MAELRWNPMIKDWVMVASNRQNRPQMPKDWCPFCPDPNDHNPDKKVPDTYEVLEVSEMESNDEVWADWLKQENEYAIGDRRSMEAGAGKYLNFIKIVLKKK